jgi:pilus assembly protein CpaF
MPDFSKRRSGGASPAVAAMQQARGATPQADPFPELLREVRSRLQAQLTPAQIEDPSAEDIRLAESIIQPLVESFRTQQRQAGHPVAETAEVSGQIMDIIFGYGALAPYFEDEAVEEIICNGPEQIFIIHAERGKELSGAKFRSAAELRNFVTRVAGGAELTRARPKLDAQIRDGSRLHAIIAPLAHNVPIAVTIRKHRLIAGTLDDLVRLGTITPQVQEFLQMAVDGRLNIVIAGGTASGKTNFLNALGNAADPEDRFVVVEDTPEIKIQLPDVVQLTTRNQAEEAQGYSIADLVIEALRMRPDRIITGEARGPEIVDVLAAANTGHDGQMLTLHANSTRDVIQRMETMYLMKGVEVPILAIRRQIADAFDLVIYVQRVMLGKLQRRFVTDIAEISPSQFMEGDQVVVQSVFQDRGRGSLDYTGYFPRHLRDKLQSRGVALPLSFLREQP